MTTLRDEHLRLQQADRDQRSLRGELMNARGRGDVGAGRECRGGIQHKIRSDGTCEWCKKVIGEALADEPDHLSPGTVLVDESWAAHLGEDEADLPEGFLPDTLRPAI